MKIFAYGFGLERAELDSQQIRFIFEDGSELEIQPEEMRNGKECIKITSCGMRSDSIAIKPVVSNQILVTTDKW